MEKESSFEPSLCSDCSDYYDTADINDMYLESNDQLHPETFDYKEIDSSEAKSFLQKLIEELSKIINVPSLVSRMLLHYFHWNFDVIKSKYFGNPIGILIELNILPGLTALPTSSDSQAVMDTVNRIKQLGYRVTPYTCAPKLNSGHSCKICFRNFLPIRFPIINPDDGSLECDDRAKVTDTFSTLNTTATTTFITTNQNLQNEIANETNNHGLFGLSCGHRFCTDCWNCYLNLKIEEGLSMEIKCMSDSCDVIVMEDFLLSILKNSQKKTKYFELVFHQTVQSHPSMRFCLGSNCSMIILALEEPKARRVRCSQCLTEFCFACTESYHAPTSCAILRQWLVKCRDDSGTANYIAAHTKDCPSCHVCIEKNEGCNHMQCSICKYEFCWVCLGDWSLHRAEYYFCSKYDKFPDTIKENARELARVALNRYVFYYERWENHERSLKLEQDHRKRIQSRIDEKVMQKQGTWIDWQYLLSAADTLRNCRYTLKYTYPHAFYGDKLERKQLFEYQQAQLEAEVEDLSWKIEHAEITDRADLQNKMDICEKHRLTLLQEFLTD